MIIDLLFPKRGVKIPSNSKVCKQRMDCFATFSKLKGLPPPEIFIHVGRAVKNKPDTSLNYVIAKK